MKHESGAALSERLLQVVPSMLEFLKVGRSLGKITPSYPRTGAQVAEFLSHRTGTPVTDVDVRAMVNYLRRQGEPIGSQPGYFYATSAAELEPTIADLAGREAAIRAAREGMASRFAGAQESLFGKEGSG